VWRIPKDLRDTIMFLLGAGGFLHELVIATAERPFILAASSALMGLPFVLKADERLRGGDKE
jgi:hypothetical protein